MDYDLITPEEKKALEKIDFINKYKSLCSKYNNCDDSFETYEVAEVVEIIKNFGYDKVKYYKSENFFKVDEIIKKDLYEISFNISLKYGLCEFIWGDPWDRLVELLIAPCGVTPASGEWECRHCTECTFRMDSQDDNMVAFRSYDELREILGVAFEMYEDYKREMIALHM